jgi:hypothetical protein
MAKEPKENENGNEPAKTRYWVSFDFGLGGNYREFYEWLDAREASECGIGVATFLSAHSRDEIAAELKQLLQRKYNPRIYIISRKEGGRFILGNRKASPWTGFAVRNPNVADEV